LHENRKARRIAGLFFGQLKNRRSGISRDNLANSIPPATRTKNANIKELIQSLLIDLH